MKLLRMAGVILPVVCVLFSMQFLVNTAKAEEGTDQTVDTAVPKLTVIQSDRTPDGSVRRKDGSVRREDGNGQGEEGRAEEYYKNEVVFIFEIFSPNLKTASVRYRLETGRTGYVALAPKGEEGEDRDIWTGNLILDDTGNDPALRGDVLTGLEIRIADAAGNTPGPDDIVNETNLELTVENGIITKSENSPDIVIDKNAPKISVVLPEPEMSANSKGNTYYYSRDVNVTVYIREANLSYDDTKIRFTTAEDGSRISYETGPENSDFMIRDGALYIFTADICDGTVFGNLKIECGDFCSNTAGFSEAAKNTYIVDTEAPALELSVSGEGVSELFTDGRYIFVKLDEPAAAESGCRAEGEEAEVTLTARVTDANLVTDPGSGYREAFFVSGTVCEEEWKTTSRKGAQELVFEKTIRVPPDSTGFLSFALKVRDLAGNMPPHFTCNELLAPVRDMVAFSDGRAEGLLVCDRSRPSGKDDARDVPEIIPVPGSRAAAMLDSGTPLYKDSVVFGLTVYDPGCIGPDGEIIFSGLREVSWAAASASGCISTPDSEHSFCGEAAASLTVPVIISGEGEADDIVLRVKVTDLSGNETEYTHFLAIDNQAPRVQMVYDEQHCQNGAFYKKGRILTITAEDQNFDPDQTIVVTGAEFSGWSRSGTVYTGIVDFSADGDYTFEMNSSDRAGNAAVIDYSGGGVNTNPQSFTVDRTPPEISLIFDQNQARNGRYYNTARTAVLTITEHNFREDGMEIEIASSLSGEQIPVPVQNGWMVEEDRWTSEIVFARDGDYSLKISYTDPAGNAAVPVSADDFTIDTALPVIKITGVSDRTAYRKGVSPVIEFSDVNFTPALCSVKWTVTGVRGVRILDAAEAGTITDIGNGRMVSLADPEIIPENDGIYTLSAAVMDLAGNMVTSDEIRYSVNRFGSVYDAQDYPETVKLIGQYTGSAPVIRIRETNPDRLISYSVRLSVNGTVKDLKEGAEFTAEEAGEDGSWNQVVYTIRDNAFQDEDGKLIQGTVSLTFYSEDAAGNLNSNRTNKEAGSPEITFTIDNTRPSGYINAAGLPERGRSIRASETDLTVYWEDNLGLGKVDVFLNGKLYSSLSGESLSRASGSCIVKAKESSGMQSVYAILTDLAGNRTELEALEFYLNSSPFLQFLKSPAAMIVLLAVTGAVAALVLLLRRMKNRKEPDR